MLTCDASPHGVGAALVRNYDGVGHPIAFASQSLLSAERHYSQIDREVLAIILGVSKFYQDLWGRPFTAVKDHKLLVGLFSSSWGLRHHHWSSGGPWKFQATSSRSPTNQEARDMLMGSAGSLYQQLLLSTTHLHKYLCWNKYTLMSYCKRLLLAWQEVIPCSQKMAHAVLTGTPLPDREEWVPFTWRFRDLS